MFDASTGTLFPPEIVATSVNPSYIAVQPGGAFVYADTEVGSVGGESTGSLTAFRVEATGKLTEISRVSSFGAEPCYVSVDRSGRMRSSPTMGAAASRATVSPTMGRFRQRPTFSIRVRVRTRIRRGPTPTSSPSLHGVAACMSPISASTKCGCTTSIAPAENPRVRHRHSANSPREAVRAISRFTPATRTSS